MIKIKIVNVVTTASLSQPMDFEILRQFGEIFHDTEVYGGRVAYFKTEQMQGKVSIFLSGKMISVGTKMQLQAQKELEMTKEFLLDKGLINDVVIEPKTQNIVATVDFGEPINLEALSQGTRAIYEPEQFTGAILRLKEPFVCSVLVFGSGKAVLTGLKSQTQIEPTIEKLQEIIESNL